MTDINLMDVYEKLQELEKVLIRFEDKLEQKTEQLVKIEKVIYGNGKTGVIDKIVEIEKFMEIAKDLPKKVLELEKFEVRVITYAAIIFSIVNFIVIFAVRYFVK